MYNIVSLCVGVYTHHVDFTELLSNQNGCQQSPKGGEEVCAVQLHTSDNILWVLHIESSSEEEEEEEEEDNLLQQSGKLLASTVRHLPKGHIELRRMKDANISKRPPVRRSHDLRNKSQGIERGLNMCSSAPLLY